MATSREVRRVSVYTRTGDRGTSMLFNGARGPKDGAVFQALGDTDELNAAIGIAREALAGVDAALTERLVDIQSRLFDVGSALATPRTGSTAAMLDRAFFPADRAAELEGWIDEMDAELPPLRNFILPGGSVAAAQLHVARAICRRAERSAVALVREGEVSPAVGRYLNRLSDFLFVAARLAGKRAGTEDAVYKKAKATDESRRQRQEEEEAEERAAAREARGESEDEG